MNRPHIVQILPMYHADGENLLNKHADVKKFTEYDEQEICNYLKIHHVDGIILRAPAKITPAILDCCRQVKAISGAGVGLDNIDVGYATKKGIAVLHAPQLNSTATAEHAVSLLLAVMKKTAYFDRETRSGNFRSRDGAYTFELEGKRLGLVGFGSIAQKAAKILISGFGMKAMAYVRSISEEKQLAADRLGVELTTSLERVFSESDAVSLHIPLTADTDKMIDNRLIELMKETAVLINTARGGVINENDLVAALTKNRILGAGVDVFTEEPPPFDHPLFQLENVTVSPHIGGITLEAARQTSIRIAENLIRAINGERVSVVANKAELAEAGKGFVS
ncbi:D-3-phosphoglycerate dehydrogenase [Cytobacillus firmus]|uniref:D-3-phosphoglycerate dehydrogenase n=2 Tax=Cytobacillus TaxID=2675230 RepID=A0A366JY15_CYTFI|nr:MULTISPECIES: hydroxyacid dehydrogenase [Cytobacillus]RBP94409.1 D-3-phosphoglycerate dehydrogenase [Cytobacillus firmus]TDX43156.1 D-3-phosphoglycerate dehydrogenase [Cytobacillus oceanisediminis]